MAIRLSPEIELALCCCRWPATPKRDELVRQAASRVSNWPQFEAVVQRNRITPLVNHALRRAGIDLPDPLHATLTRRADLKARRALAMARETIRLQRAFDEEGVSSLILKGSPLAILAYGDLGMKEARDIDLLVDVSDLSRVMPILSARGYTLEVPGLQPDQLMRYAAHASEVQFQDEARELTVDLHWRLVDNERWMRGGDATGPAQEVVVAGSAVRTLADEEMFAFLCVHGSSHSWSRLKWLADLHAFVQRRTAVEITHLFLAAANLGAGRSASVALLLCHRLFGLDVSEQLYPMLDRGRISRMLQHNAIAGLAYGAGAVEHNPYSAPWLRMRLGHLFVAGGVAGLVQQLRLIWRSPDDRVRLVLPSSLDIVYHALRIPMWLGRLVGLGRR